MMMMRFKNETKHKQSQARSLQNLSHLALATLFVIYLASPVQCDYQDAVILNPVVSALKGIIGMVADGHSLSFDFSSADLVHSMGLLVWRAKFPMRMPSGVLQKGQDLANRVNNMVNITDVTLLSRKTMSQLGQDMRNVVDAIHDHVRRSSDGIYTNYLNTQVNGKSLEQALFDIGLQLKAYKIDLMNYRDLADMLLGLPIVPHLVGGITTAVSASPNIETLKTITQALITNSNQAANMAKVVVQQGANTVNTIPGLSSITNMIATPISAVSNGVINPSGIITRFVPNNAIPTGAMTQPLAPIA